MPPGGGLIAQNVPAPGIEGGTLYLVTDLGIKYPLPSAEVAKALGYGAAAPVPVPAGTLDFLPTGPPLDPAAAATSQSAVAPIPPG